MPNRPTERINFVVEKWRTSLKVKAFLYTGDVLEASTSRTVPLNHEQYEWVRVADLMDVVNELVRHCDGLRIQPPLF